MNCNHLFSKRWPMVLEGKADPERFPEGLRPVIELFLNDAGSVELNAQLDFMQTLFIHSIGDEAVSDFMLRLKTYDQYLTIARVEFIHKRQGNMERLEKILLGLAREIGYRGIQIECANSPSILGYVQKHAYLPKPNVPGSFCLKI